MQPPDDPARPDADGAAAEPRPAAPDPAAPGPVLADAAAPELIGASPTSDAAVEPAVSKSAQFGLPPTSQLEPLSDARFGAFRIRRGERNIASAIYGQILVLSVLAAFTPDEMSSWEIFVEIAITQIVFWVGHAYAEVVAAEIEVTDRSVGFEMVWETMRRQSPLAAAAIPSLVMLLLAMCGLISNDTAITIAFGFGVVALFLWGVQAARQTHRTRSRQLVLALLSAGFGLVIVALKVLAHH